MASLEPYFQIFSEADSFLVHKTFFYPAVTCCTGSSLFSIDVFLESAVSVVFDVAFLSGISQVVKQCCSTDGVEPTYIREDILPDFFKHFWTHRMALDRRNYRQVSVGLLCHYTAVFVLCVLFLVSLL